MKHLISLITVSLLLASCGSDESGSSLVTGTFIDSSVTSFSYTTGGVAVRSIKKSGREIINLALPAAMAAVNESFSCNKGESIEFSMTALSNNVDVVTTCTSASTIERNIRVGLLESMEGANLERTVFGLDPADHMTMDLSVFAWDTAIEIPAGGPGGCVETYTFSKASGTVVLDEKVGTGCVGDYPATFAFKFTDGRLFLGAASDSEAQSMGCPSAFEGGCLEVWDVQ